VPQRHTDKAPALSRTSRQRGETNGGDERRVANGHGIIPRARVPVGLVHHPAGTSRATGQADASSHGDAAAGPAPGHSSVILGPDPRTEDRRRLARETHAAGKNAERGAGRSHINYLDRLLLAPRPIPRVKPEDKIQPPRREQSRPAAKLGVFDIEISPFPPRCRPRQPPGRGHRLPHMPWRDCEHPNHLATSADGMRPKTARFTCAGTNRRPHR
jgi:hypothetical protein